jgi:aconitate hydratase
MGVLPLEFLPGETPSSLGLTGFESFDVEGLAESVASGFAGGKRLRVVARPDAGAPTEFEVRVRIDTPTELDYYVHGGILSYVLRELAGS